MSRLKLETAVANQGGAMEAATILKKRAESKSHTSRRNFTMKRAFFLICISLSFFAGKVVAQNGKAPNEIELRKMMKMNAPELHKDYRSATWVKAVGAGLTCGGIAAFILSFTVDDATPTSGAGSVGVNVNTSGKAETGMLITGLVMAAAGTPMWIIGKNKTNHIKNVYYEEFGYGVRIPVKPSPYLQLQSTSNGVGLAFVF